jgi:formate--tetrahydrofolate ligase
MHLVRRSVGNALRIRGVRSLTDEAIAKKAKLVPIANVAKKMGLEADDTIPYGRYKAKVPLEMLGRQGKSGKLILVTAITPTKAGEGKTTTSVGLCDGLNRIGKNCVVALR